MREAFPWLLRRFGCLLALCLSVSSAQARVFDFSSDTVSTYLRGSGGFSILRKAAFEDSSGTSTLFEDQVDYNFSGEIGFAFSGETMTFRLGVEGLLPQELGSIAGSSASGVTLMNLDSESLAVIPKVALEFFLYRDSVARLMVGGSLGYASIKTTNKYTLTSDGTAIYPGVSDFSEVLTGTTWGGDIFLGIERLFVDNVTFTAEVGYRYYKFTDLSHDQATTTFLGAVSEGDEVLNADGSRREMNLSGVFIGIGLRFYLDLN